MRAEISFTVSCHIAQDPAPGHLMDSQINEWKKMRHTRRKTVTVSSDSVFPYFGTDRQRLKPFQLNAVIVMNNAFGS